MIDLLIITVAALVAGWASWPPRGERRGALALGLAVLWAALILVGWQREVLPGFGLWLAVLALMGALAALLVVWSIANLLGRARGKGEE